MQTIIDSIKALIGDWGPAYNSYYATLAVVVFIVVFILVMSAVIRVVDRR